MKKDRCHKCLYHKFRNMNMKILYYEKVVLQAKSLWNKSDMRLTCVSFVKTDSFWREVGFGKSCTAQGRIY